MSHNCIEFDKIAEGKLNFTLCLRVLLSLPPEKSLRVSVPSENIIISMATLLIHNCYDLVFEISW